jgi:hypothetical protein
MKIVGRDSTQSRKIKTMLIFNHRISQLKIHIQGNNIKSLNIIFLILIFLIKISSI